MTGRDQLRDERGIDRDVRTGEERRRVRVGGAPEAEHRRREAERLGEIRQRRNADAAADEQRSRDIETEAVPKRAEDVDRVARLELAQGLGARTDRIDQERELAGRRKTERERPRQQPAGCLEHEELPGRAGIERAALEPQQRVEPHRLDAVHAEQLATPRH